MIVLYTKCNQKLYLIYVKLDPEKTKHTVKAMNEDFMPRWIGLPTVYRYTIPRSPFHYNLDFFYIGALMLRDLLWRQCQ